ncbi:hypothetical protein MNBD_GAMMA16-108 [hydrothermal vent metagenome]|uniref:Uncharacterized protein n=1 Tax=hydrothermal vent metagenome TaxID=652676 RepID=A0A3B0ZKE4_9ZZZZ
MLGFLKSGPAIDKETADWIFDVFKWSLAEFDTHTFNREAVLVVPNNTFFPGKADSTAGMAELIFRQVQKYAGLNHWPCRLVDQNGFQGYLEAGLPTAQNSELAMPPSSEQTAGPVIPYHTGQVATPDTLIAHYASVLAFYLGGMAKTEPPGGQDSYGYAMEILAIKLGFGVLIANTAYNFRGGCGKCSGPKVEREIYLSQDEAIYALALFAAVKELPTKEVTTHLKAHLKSVYKRAAKDISQQESKLKQLRTLKA